jgi:septum formation protein
MRLVLASSSRQRAEILRQAGFDFETVPTHADESPRVGEPPEDYVRRIALAKARAAMQYVKGSAMIVGADTVIVLDGIALGKPLSVENGRSFLRRLSGQAHEVLTGLAVIRLPDGMERVTDETTKVTLAPLSAQEIEDYIATRESLDKAGGYAIQGRAGRFVTRVEGCYFNVVGLPLARLYGILQELGWQTDLAGA